MAGLFRYVTLAATAAGSLCGACRATAPIPFTRPTDDGGTTITIPDAGTSDDGGGVQLLPHALLSADPAHGPFSGGTLVLLRGNGFTTGARVWFGTSEVASSNVLAIDAHRIQVTAPAGDAGLTDLFVQNGDDASTRVTLPGGYAYDSFYADPNNGPTSGGTLVTLHGDATAWDSATTVSIDRNPCPLVSVLDATTLQCQAPPGTEGAKPIQITTSDGVAVDVLDAFTYQNSDNGFRGGLSGAPLADSLKVLVFDNVAGDAIPGASVIVGVDDPAVSATDGSGVALVSAPKLGPRVTVTVARKCFQPITFVDVPVDTVTAYLDPVLSPACFSPQGDLESGGGTPRQTVSVSGELVWPQAEEFRKSGFTNVPDPMSASETQVAYVLPLATQPTQSFRLPSANNAVTPMSDGTTGYDFSLFAVPGSYSLYALAGIQNSATNPPTFTAYAMGIIRGVAVPAGENTSDVFIRIDAPLDQALTLAIDGPLQTSKGPNLMQANVAVRVGSDGYAILPNGQQQALLGAMQTLNFVGVPALTGSLSNASYVAAAQAVTGRGGGLPRSVLGLLGATSTSAPLSVGPFVEIPVLTTPAANSTWNGRDLAWSFAPGGLSADLSVIDVATAAGLYDWRIVTPGDASTVRLPDLAAVDAELAWPAGEQTFSIVRATVQGFAYGSLVYRDLGTQGWTAYAADSFFANY